MALDLKQQLKLTQSLVMTPQLQQAIKLLQLNRLELANVLRQEMSENPILEEGPDFTEEELQEAEPTAKEHDKIEEVQGKGEGELDWEEYLANYSSSTPIHAPVNNEELPSYENFLTKGTNLIDHLEWQLGMSALSEKDQIIGRLLIGNIDDNGYLRATTEEIGLKNDIPVDEVERVLKKVQEFDPHGVAARDLCECLLLQTMELTEHALVRVIIRDHLHNLEKKNYKLIQRETGASFDEVIEAVKFISDLDPKPGRYYTEHSPQYITPDIYVYKISGEYVIVLNEDGLPKLKVSNYYRNTLNSEKSKGDAKEYIQDKLRSAVWLIRSIHQRQRTIYKVSDSIVKHQRDFLERGVAALKPMILKDIADDIEMHESTVSRVTNNKFIHTPQGIFELKYFFNSSIKRFEGDSVASESVKSKIKQIVGNENPTNPYSDQQIVDILKDGNIDIARRTVAKYREMLSILPSSKRRKLF